MVFVGVGGGGRQVSLPGILETFLPVPLLLVVLADLVLNENVLGNNPVTLKQPASPLAVSGFPPL
jgi:hypothetical protein